MKSSPEKSEKGKVSLSSNIGERRSLLLEAIVRSGEKERQHELGHRVMGKKYFVKQSCSFEEKSYEY